MPNYSLEHNALVENTLHIKTAKGGYGSAWLHFPNEEPEKAYLFTARHCLFGENEPDFTSNVEVEIVSMPLISKFLAESEDCQLLKYDGSAKADDVAILIVPRKWFLTFSAGVVDFGKLPPLPIACQLVGFPKANNNQFKELRGRVMSQRANESTFFDIILDNDVRTHLSDGKEAVKGMSGGGVFMTQGERKYLIGIIIEFDETYKEVSVISVERLEWLLKKAHLPPLLFSYSNTLGLDASKFSTLLNISYRDLGSRYSPKLNFDLPIAEIFQGLAFDAVFQNKAKTAFHNLLRDVSKNTLNSTNEAAFEPHKPYFLEQADWFRQFYQEIEWSANSANLTLEKLKQLKTAIRDFFYETQEIKSKLRDANYELKKEQDKQNDYIDPLGWAISHVGDIETAIRDFDNDFLSHKMLDLAISRCLILRGVAGSGKSHLLADIAAQRDKRGLPSLLILGQKMTHGDIWQQIMAQIGVNCTRKVLLKTLNDIGKHIGSRFLLMVDAINEGGGKTLWLNQLGGFIEEIKAYTFIGLVVSVRSTYYEVLVPEHLRNDPSVTKVEHRGFEGHEWEVVQHFCKNFGLETPRFPVLAPEFSNPQFLFLLCQSLQNLRKTTFPFGTNGIAWLYQTFTEGINNRVLKGVEFSELAWSHVNFIQKAVDYFADNIVEKEGHRLTNDAAFLLFNKFDYCPKPHFLQVLLNENVLLRDMHHDFDTQKNAEFVQFSYERFGDFAIARRLLDRHFDPNNSKETFAEGGYLKTYFHKDFYQKEGIFDAVILYLAEDYGLEIFEIISDKWFDAHHDIQLDKRRFHLAFFSSLEWRSIEKIDFEKIEGYINDEILRGHWRQSFFLWLLRFATIPNHPLNIEILHGNLFNQSLGERDGRWLQQINSEYTEENSIIQRLINWARDRQVQNVSDDVAELAATTFAWFLVSTNQPLRDASTLALVNLLETKPLVMGAILEKFKTVNDPYVSERLYAAAYGVALRSPNTEGVRSLAQWVYDTVFKNGEPPVHILLREYAQGIIEWALHQKMAIEVNVALVRPPYKSAMPELPTEKKVAHFDIDYKSPEFKKNEYQNQAQNIIVSSVTEYGDFNRYVISNAVERFHTVSFRDAEYFKQFKKRLKGDAKILMSLIESSITIIRSKKANETIPELKETLKQELPQWTSQLIGKLSEEDAQILMSKIIPYLTIPTKSNHWERQRFDHKPIARWILQRVFELGWKKERHGEFDDRITRWADYGRSSDSTKIKTERIGKKYQWIAFHEILARLTDNYYLDRDGISSLNKPMPYRGTWNMYLRNIDPTLTVDPASKEDESNRTDKLQYDNWDMPTKTWLAKTDDLPNVSKIIIQQSQSPPQYEWLNLYANPDWTESTPFGEEEYKQPRKQIWYQIRSYLVKQAEEKAIIDWMSQQNFWNHWMPQVMEHSTVFHREFYWSAAYRDETKDREEKLKWSTFRNTRFKGIITTEQFSAGGGSYALQDGLHINRPSQYIFEKMGLQYSPKDGKWIDESGEIIVYDPSVSSKEKSSLLVRRDVFEAFLKREKLAVVWTIMGEKQILGNNHDRENRVMPLILNGTFSLNHGKLLDGKPENHWFT